MLRKRRERWSTRGLSRMNCRWICVFAALCISAAGARAGSPVALITELDGTAQRIQKPANTSLAPRAALSVNEALLLDADARLVVAFTAAGVIVEARGPGRVRVGREALLALDPSAQIRVRDPLAALRQLRLAPQQAVQASIVMRSGASDALGAVSPIGVVTMAQARKLAWTGSNATTVQLELIDAAGNSVIRFESSATSLVLPDALRLERGRTYIWTLAPAQNAGAKIADIVAAEFVILDAETDAALTDLAQRGATDPTSRLLHSIAAESLRRQTFADSRIVAR